MFATNLLSWPGTETPYHEGRITVVVGLHVKWLRANLKGAMLVMLQIPVIPFLYLFKPHLFTLAFPCIWCQEKSGIESHQNKNDLAFTLLITVLFLTCELLFVVPLLPGTWSVPAFLVLSDSCMQSYLGVMLLLNFELREDVPLKTDWSEIIFVFAWTICSFFFFFFFSPVSFCDEMCRH